LQPSEPVGGRLEILARSDLDRIHAATLEVYRRVGIKVWEPRARELFRQAGADVDAESLMVRIPEDLVKEAVKRAPAEFFLYGRDPSYRLRYGGRRVHYSLAGQPVRVHDLSGKIRSGTVQDVEDLARLADACENFHHISRMTTPADVPAEVHHLYTLWAIWRNSIKPTNGYNYGATSAQQTIEMAAILRGGHEELVKRPMLMGITNPVSPLQLSQELIEGALIYAKYKQPMVYAPEAIAGATAPATLAGVLVQQNAEVLAGIVLSQLASPGTPVLYGTVSTVLDMRTGATALGGPEVALFNIATAQLARYYRLPSRGTGGNTDSKLPDVQASLESALGVLAAALAGMNFIYDAGGSLEGSLTLSYEKLLIDNELCGMVSRILRGININDETLAVEEICRVGPSASYLASPFTLKTFRKEHFIPTLLDRRSREAWLKAGGRDLGAEAREKARQIIRDHRPEPVEQDVQVAMERFIREETGKCAS